MKKINILYIFWFLALGLFIWILLNLRNQGATTIFGTADSETYSISVDYAAMISERRVQQGDKVKQGDTLMVLVRTETDKNISDLMGLIRQYEVDRTTKNNMIDREQELFDAQQSSESEALRSQIRIKEKELEIQDNLLGNLGGKKQKEAKNLKELELDGLMEQLAQVDKETQRRHNSFDSERRANDKNYEAKLAYYTNDIDYYRLEKNKAIVRAPCDGIVENVFVLPHDMTSSYKELLRINSYTPNRVTGFVHESINIPFKLGDTVNLVSAARPEVKTRGVIIGNGSNLVELPLRLRKFVEIRAWGREVYMKMDANNDFFIGEKILVQINE
jgi:multidrug resistance efflux pump